jgi:hypothetical protein
MKREMREREREREREKVSGLRRKMVMIAKDISLDSVV